MAPTKWATLCPFTFGHAPVGPKASKLFDSSYRLTLTRFTRSISTLSPQPGYKPLTRKLLRFFFVPDAIASHGLRQQGVTAV